MPQETTYSWIPTFEAISKALLSYRNNRSELIRKLENVFRSMGKNLPKLDSLQPPSDIDPFTVLALLARKNNASEVLERLQAFLEEFKMQVAAPRDFSGLSQSNPRNLTLYPFSNNPKRKDTDIEALWDLFVATHQLIQADTSQAREAFTTAYDRASKVAFTKWKLCIALYYAAPDRFVCLDLSSRWLLGSWNYKSPSTKKMSSYLLNKHGVPSGKNFLSINEALLGELKQGSFGAITRPCELVDKAWVEWQSAPKIWIYQPENEKGKELALSGKITLPYGELPSLDGLKNKESIQAKLQSLHPDSGRKYQNEALWCDRFKALQVGETVYLRAPHGKTTLAVGTIISDYLYEADVEPQERHSRQVNWIGTKKSDLSAELGNRALLDEIHEDISLVEALEASFSAISEDDIPEKSQTVVPYLETDFLSEAYCSEKDMRDMLALLERKKALILQGPPGVGKTFLARRLAYLVMGERVDEKSGRLQQVQFHQSYSYEDFIMGFRPTETGFEFKEGSFYKFCQRASADPDRQYVFLIDEINRGNLSKIFGELFTLLEANKRGEKVSLLYKDELFSVPENVYLIGMMNTADRSIAMVDFALRRRFAFFTLCPAFDSENFKAYQVALGSTLFNKLVEVIKALNKEISLDPSLGKGYQIGHSFLSGLSAKDLEDPFTFESIVDYEIAPLLSEYWFDDEDKAQEWVDKLRSAFNDSRS